LDLGLVFKPRIGWEKIMVSGEDVPFDILDKVDLPG
jgi:hypothetical protein